MRTPTLELLCSWLCDAHGCYWAAPCPFSTFLTASIACSQIPCILLAATLYSLLSDCVPCMLLSQASPPICHPSSTRACLPCPPFLSASFPSGSDSVSVESRSSTVDCHRDVDRPAKLNSIFQNSLDITTPTAQQVKVSEGLPFIIVDSRKSIALLTLPFPLLHSLDLHRCSPVHLPPDWHPPSPVHRCDTRPPCPSHPRLLLQSPSLDQEATARGWTRSSPSTRLSQRETEPSRRTPSQDLVTASHSSSVCSRSESWDTPLSTTCTL